jgi:hypothetical protein
LSVHDLVKQTRPKTQFSSPKSKQMRRNARSRWRRVMKEVGLIKQAGYDTQVPMLGPLSITDHGVKAEVEIGAISATADMLRSKKLQIESGLGAHDSSVRYLRPGWVTLTLLHTDPLAEVVRVSDLPAPTRPGCVVTGLDEDGQGVEKDMRLMSLTVGAQGAGKTSETWTLLHQLLVSNVPLRVRVHDPKGTEFAELAEVVHDYSGTPDGWPRLLAATLDDLGVRLADMSKAGIREITDYTWEWPLDILIVDEMLQLKAYMNAVIDWANREDRAVSDKAGQALPNALMSQGRSAGFTFWALTQLVHKAVLGPDIVDLFAYKNLLRVQSKEQVDMTLNAAGMSAMYPAHLFSQERALAGIGYVDTRTDRGIVRYRAAQLTDEERQWTVNELSGLYQMSTIAKETS